MSDNIKHVIYLLLENRSFDHVLGCFKQTYPQLEGVDEQALKQNSYGGAVYQQTAGSTPFLKFDPRHEHEHVVVQRARMEIAVSSRTTPDRTRKRRQATYWR
jgi:phospholipase C